MLSTSWLFYLLNTQYKNLQANMEINFMLIPFNLLKNILKYTGLYVKGKHSSVAMFFGYLMYFTMQILLTCEQIAHLYLEEDWREKVVNLALATTIIGLYIKLSLYLTHVKMFDHMENRLKIIILMTSNKSVDEIFNQKLNLLKKIFKSYAITLGINISIAFVVAFGFHQLPYKAYYPFNTDKFTVGFYLAAVQDTVGAVIGSSVAFFCDLYPIIHIIMITGVLDGIALRLKKINTKNVNARKELEHCIKIHQMVLPFVRDLQKSFSFVFLFQVLASTLIVGLTAFSMSMRHQS